MAWRSLREGAHRRVHPPPAGIVLSMLLGLAVFVAVYALLAVPRLGRRLREAAEARWGRAGAVALSRPGIAVAGALLVVILAQVAPLDALRAVDLRILALLVGMMLLVAALDVANGFALLASWLTRSLHTPARLLVGSMVLVAVLSALVLNDAVVLLFTPVLVRAARALDVSPMPFLVGEALAANLGSAATPTGNPQNAAIATARDLSFMEFVVPLAPVALAGLAVGVAFCLFAFRRDLARPARPRASTMGPVVTQPRMMGVAAGALAVALVGFVWGPQLGVPLWAAALGGGFTALVLAPAARVSPRALAGRVDVGILAFFVGLFVLLEVVRESAFVPALTRALDAGGAGTLVLATAILSNVVSNVPAVLVLLPSVPTAEGALLLAASSTFAGNATFLGSAATVIVAEAARREGADFSVLKLTLVGLPLAVVTLLLAWGMMG